MKKSEVDRLEGYALGKGPARPRDAATLILLDRRASGVHVLIGRRHAAHAFMPGKFVFPGGRHRPCRQPRTGRLAARPAGGSAS